MKVQKINYKSIYYSSGGILMRIIIFLELFTFGMVLMSNKHRFSVDKRIVYGGCGSQIQGK